LVYKVGEFKYIIMSTRKKNKIQSDKIDIRFCTECGEQLDEFAFDGRAENVKGVLQNHELCKKTGKFKGDCCSKLFIATENQELLEDTED